VIVGDSAGRVDPAARQRAGAGFGLGKEDVYGELANQIVALQSTYQARARGSIPHPSGRREGQSGVRTVSAR
jgi:hypothetical protein